MGIKVNFKAGGSITKFKPVFSSNSETIFVPWRNSILSYNVKTGNFLSEYKRILGVFAGFDVHLYNGYECVTACSSTGDLITWELGSQFKIINKKLELKNIKTCNILPSPYDEQMELLLTYETKKRIVISLFDINKSTQKKINIKIDRKFPYFIDIGGRNKYVALAQKNWCCFVDLKTMNITKINKLNCFTCLTCHPEQELVFLGDKLGRVIVVSDLFAKKPVQTIYHWHTLPLQAVCPSPAGTTFYSGGKECVLVKWQTDNDHDKKFLPRLAAPIEKINVSPNNLYCAIVTNDNAIKIIDANFKQISLIQNFAIGEHFEGGIVFDPRTKSLIMNADIGHIQFYSPLERSLIYKVDVVGQNKVPLERNMEIETTHVRKFAVNKLGTWLATVEERHDWKYSREIRLKFWFFNLIKQTFELNTLIEYPHEKSINSILFQPLNNDTDLKCITVGDDCCFKVWLLVENEENLSWRCLCKGYFRDLPCQGLSFAADSSLVAIGFGVSATTWVPDTCELKCSLVHPSFRESIKFVEFGRSIQCHLLVAASENRLTVWNLLTLTAIWTVPVEVDILLSSQLITHMALITRDKSLFVFNLDNPKPIFKNDKLLNRHEKILAAAFIPVKSGKENSKWYQRMPIYFIDGEKELFSIGDDEENAGKSVTVEENDATSVFSKTLPKTTKNLVGKANPVKHKFKGEDSIKNYFGRTIHTMMPIRMTCETLLKSMIIKKNVQEIGQ